MRAALFTDFKAPLTVRDVPVPRPGDDDAIVAVRACGICRSDWHGWMGHDTDVRPPHVPGHEFAGVVAAVGAGVRGWRVGDRVTAPFSCGCGICPECRSGNHQVCDAYTQPGFTHWGAFAEFVEVRHADTNLVSLPAALDFVTAASLGCRFATAFRAVVDRARAVAGEWVAVHGCGGVGLSAVMIARALGARVVAVDVRSDRLAAARDAGAEETIDASVVDAAERIHGVTGRGAQVSLDALGSRETSVASIRCLAKRGRHVQVGLLVGDQARPPLPMELVVGRELEILGSHGLQAPAYPRMFALMRDGRLDPRRLVSDVVSLSEGADLLTRFDQFPHRGITVIEFPEAAADLEGTTSRIVGRG